MTKVELTRIQRDALEAAAVRNDLTIFPVRSRPELNAGSAAKLVKTLITKGLAEERPAEGKMPAWRIDDDGRRIAVLITTAGLAAIGMAPVGKARRRSRAAGKKAPVAAKQPVLAAVSQDEAPRPRPGSKLAMLASLLERKEGATIAELSEAVGWQPHSVRGVMSGMLAKKFAMRITSDTTEGRGRVYRALRP
jgi:hypothetical protein